MICISLPLPRRLFAAPLFALLAVLAVTTSSVAQSPTHTRIVPSPNPSTLGATVDITAEVDGLGGGAPTGPVRFFAAGSRLGEGILRAPGAGQATISAGYEHTCALTSTGGVVCWGRNSQGQIGDGTLAEGLGPTPVNGLASGVVAISSGGDHSCALTDAGAVKCWGKNYFGEIGDGSTVNRLAPVAVTGLTSGVVAISAGINHSCALTSVGGVKCWGSNDSGQLGLGRKTNARLTPVDVVGLESGVVAIAASRRYTCAVTRAGGAKCWGDNYYGQLGDGTNTLRYAPVDVSGLTSGVAALSPGGEHNCALTTGGGVKCWGANYVGEVGDGTTIHRRTPVDVIGLASGVAAITAGGGHVCALTTGGAVKCWGSNERASLGNGTTTDSSTPVDVIGMASGITAITAGQWHSCALTAAGVAKCWGDNGEGQLGNGVSRSQTTPVSVRDLPSTIAAVAAGDYHACALTSGGAVYCWGANYGGQLGDDTRTDRRTPAAVWGLSSGVAAIAAGASHSCALTRKGAVKCWGSNYWGELGDGTTGRRRTPVAVSGLTSGVTQIRGWRAP